MKARFPIWSAVLAGMASPASLYGERQDYRAYAAPRPVSQSFAAAGLYMSTSMATVTDVGTNTNAARSRKTARRVQAS
jgi:hypothetical protein